MRTRAAVVCCLIGCVQVATGATILYDDSHDGNGDELGGNLSSFASLVTGSGIGMVEFNGAPGDLTAAVLDGYDALFIHDTELSYTATEIQAIADFVAGGGGLLISGNAPGNFNQASNNALMAAFGVTFNEAVSPQDTVSFASHPLVDGLSLVTGDGVGRLSVSGTTQLVGFNASGQGTIAVRDAVAGSGRVVATGDGAPLLNSFLGQGDNAEWALRAAQYVVVPEPGSLMLLGVAVLAGLRRVRAA